MAGVWSPTVEAMRYVRAKLTADPVLSPLIGTRVYEAPAPFDAVDPFVAMLLARRPEELHALGATIVTYTVHLRVLAAQQGSSVSSPFDLEAIDQRITTVLHRSSGATTTGALILDCVHERAALSPRGFEVAREFDARTGVSYSQLGSDWQLIIQ